MTSNRKASWVAAFFVGGPVALVGGCVAFKCGVPAVPALLGAAVVCTLAARTVLNRI